MNQKTSIKELRQFGITTGILLIVIFSLFIPWFWEVRYFHWPWYVGGVLILLGVVLPKILDPVYVVWMKFAHVLGWVNTRLILGLVFYTIFLPVSLVFKVIGKDPMAREFDKSMPTYRKEPHHLESDMEKPF